jgi:hypothetical protein
MDLILKPLRVRKKANLFFMLIVGKGMLLLDCACIYPKNIL